MQHQETIKGLICPGSNLSEETQLCNISLGQQIPCHQALLNEIVPGKQLGKSKSSQIGSGKRGCMKFSAGQKGSQLTETSTLLMSLPVSCSYLKFSFITGVLMHCYSSSIHVVRLHELYYMAYKSLLTQQPNLQ